MTAQNASRNMSLVDAQPDTASQITVSVIEQPDGAGLTVSVSPRVVALAPGLHYLQWSLSPDTTPGWSIASITGGGIAAQVNDNDVWTSGFMNGLTAGQSKQHFPYTIYLTKTFDSPTIVARIGVDPVIENDPPSS